MGVVEGVCSRARRSDFNQPSGIRSLSLEEEGSGAGGRGSGKLPGHLEGWVETVDLERLLGLLDRGERKG